LITPERTKGKREKKTAADIEPERKRYPKRERFIKGDYRFRENPRSTKKEKERPSSCLVSGGAFPPEVKEKKGKYQSTDIAARCNCTKDSHTRDTADPSNKAGKLLYRVFLKQMSSDDN
jgi:hypothetical protein